MLEELVEREIPGGQDAMKRLLSAIDKELDDLPDDFKMPTAEKIKLSAREILGAMDSSQEKEFIYVSQRREPETLECIQRLKQHYGVFIYEIYGEDFVKTYLETGKEK